MSYSWVRHVKSVAHFFGKNGAGYTRQLYAEDAQGNAILSTRDPRAVKMSLIGINSQLLFDHAAGDIQLYLKLVNVSVKLWGKAGAPCPPGQHAPTTGIMRFSRDNDWPAVEQLVRRAYKIALESEQQHAGNADQS